MADQAGTILHDYGHCPEYLEFFSTSRFDSGSSISGRTRTEAGQVRPRWFGQDLSEVPDSGIGLTQDSRTGRNSVGWCDQNTFQPTSPQPIRRKRRAGDRVETKSDVGRDVRREGTRWGIPRKRALFGQENKIVGEIDWEHPGIHRGNLITCAGSERVTDRVCSIK